MESSERYRLLIESVEEIALYLVDPARQIATWNRGSEILSGYSQEAVGMPVSELYASPEQTKNAGQSAYCLFPSGRLPGYRSAASTKGWFHRCGFRFRPGSPGCVRRPHRLGRNDAGSLQANGS